MQRAMDITIEAYKATVATLHQGMTQNEFMNNKRRRPQGARCQWTHLVHVW